LNVKLIAVATPVRVAVIALAASLAGCSTLNNIFGGDETDYRKAAANNKPLEVPPDLSQLARDSRFQVQSGVVSASGVGARGSTVPGAGVSAGLPPGSVAPLANGELKIERTGQDRWLVVPAAPETIWPTVRAFWEQKGFTLAVADARTGIIETTWSEDRAKLPADAVRNVLGRLLANVYDTGERDRYRTRIERTATGSEIYVSHRGAQEIYTDVLRENTRWQARPSDPQLEAEYLSLLMVALGAKEEPARAAVAAAAPTAATAGPRQPAQPARARLVAAGAAALDVDDPFDRAWRRVGLALDRGGFTVEDRDRNGGLYYVRYVDPKTAGQEEPGFWSRLFGDGRNPMAAVRYRVALKAEGNLTRVTVQTSAGGADVGENGQRIAALLVEELR